MTLMPVWPAGFLQMPKMDDWQGAPIESRVIFEPEAGSAMFRARVTAEAWAFAGTFPTVETAEKEALLDWWRVDIRRGSLPFLWRDPEDDQVRKWGFSPNDPIRTSRIGPRHWDIRLAVTRLASTPWWASLIPEDRLVAPVAAYDLARGLYHNGLAQVGAGAAITTSPPGLIRAHGLSDVRLVTGAGAVTTLLSVTLGAGWWPSPAPSGLASITVFAPGALT